MEDTAATPHSPHTSLPELDDQDLIPAFERSPPMETVSPALLGDALARLLSYDSFHQTKTKESSKMYNLTRASYRSMPTSSSISSHSASMHSQERTALLTEAQSSERMTVAASALLSPLRSEPPE